MKNCPCWHAWWDQSFLPDASSCLWALHTRQRKHTTKHQAHTLEALRKDRHERWEIIHTTHKFCACVRVKRVQQAHTRLQMWPPRAPSLPLLHVMTTTDDPQMENDLYLLTRPDDTQTRAHACSLAFTVVVSSGHSPMKITWWTTSSSEKTTGNLYPEKTSTNNVKKNREDSEAKLTGHLIPAVL